MDGYDTSNNTYRITFDRNGLGAHSIPDHEVLSTEPMETLPLSNFSQRPKPRPVPQPVVCYPSPMKYTPNFSPQLANDPLLSGSTPKGKVMHLDGRLGGYPVKFLDLIVRLSKCLKKKRELVTSLRDLNTHGERLKSFGEYISEDFQRRYAGTVIELSNLNRDLNEYLADIKEYTQQVKPTNPIDEGFAWDINSLRIHFVVLVLKWGGSNHFVAQYRERGLSGRCLRHGE